MGPDANGLRPHWPNPLHAAQNPLHAGLRPARGAGYQAGTAAVTPDQQRTMSRTETTPIGSRPSRTMRWRKLPRSIAAAASSKVHWGAANTTSVVAIGR